jgi:hypothetical protein
MKDPALDIRYSLAGIGLVPAPVQLLGRNAKLDNQIARQVLRFDFATLFPPEPEEMMIRASEPPIKYRRPELVLDLGCA